MNRHNLRIAFVMVCILAVSVVVCRAQVEDPATATSSSAGSSNTSGAPSDQSVSSSGGARADTPAAAGASSWTAGGTTFTPAGPGTWAGNKASFGGGGGAAWTAAGSSFGEPVQAGGIWRDNGAAPTPRSSAAAESMPSVKATGVLPRRATAHAGTAGSVKSHLAGASLHHGGYNPGARHAASGPAHHSAPPSGLKTAPGSGSSLSTDLGSGKY